MRQPETIVVSADPAIIAANGISTTNVTVTVTDINGDPVPHATIALTTTAGTLTALSGSADANGVWSTVLTSDIYVQTATVTARSAYKEGSTTVQFVDMDDPLNTLIGSYTANKTGAYLNEEVVYTFVLTNNGQANHDNVIMSATLPEYTVIMGTVDGATYYPVAVMRARRNGPAASVNEGYIRWTGSLKPGESHTFTFTVVVDWSIFMPSQRVMNSTGVGFLGDNVNYSHTVPVDMLPKYRIYFMIVYGPRSTSR